MPLIRPTRRDLLKLATVAPAFVMPASARAFLGAPQQGNPAHFRFTLGEARITVLSDGYFTQPMSGRAVNADEAEKLAFLSEHFLPLDANYAHTNHLYVEIGDAKVLVDVGSGSRFIDTAGRLMGNMEAAGIDPIAITHVIITHAHPDHIWGIRDDFDEPLIPDAEYLIGADEHAYWLQDGLVNRVPETDQQFVVGAVNSLNAEGLEWTLAADGHEVVPGIRMIATPGHTAGHMSVLVENADHALLATGDAMMQPWMNFAHPEWYDGIDQDGDTTVATRKRLLDMAAADRITLLGYHFPFPGVGHVKRDGAAYQFVPALWKF